MDKASSTSSFEKIALDDEITPADEQPAPAPAMATPFAAPTQQQQQRQQSADPAEPRPAPQAPSDGGSISSFFGFPPLFGGGAAAAPAAAAPAAAAGPSGTGANTAGVTVEDDPIKELEVAAAKVAEQAGRAAKAAGSKLKEGASELAANLTSWWANLEPGDRFALPGVSTQSKHQDYAALQEALGLESGEAVLESFGCHLLQTYTCTNNPFTPDRQVAFAGQLHITSQRVCFVVEGERGVGPVKLDIKAIKTVKKEATVTGLPERLVLTLSDDGKQSLVFGKFTLKEMEMDSALALLEHLTSD
ncbi:hypothetical protein N2152v2_004420 [Parachlorella kessleri]